MAPPTRVLLADQVAEDRQVQAGWLRQAGFEVVEAADFQELLAQLEQQNPRIVLLDAALPGPAGQSATRYLRARFGSALVPVIAVAAADRAAVLDQCVSAGADDVLIKPLHPALLRAKLDMLGRQRELHATLQRQRDEIERYNLHLLGEQQAAKALFDRVAHGGALTAPCLSHLISPLALFNGDVLLAAPNPAGCLHLLVGDFTGHGLTAAVGTMPLAEVFYGMTLKGFSIRDIVRECNRKLKAMLPVGYFCCATLLEVNFAKGSVEYWNGGLPPGRVFGAATGQIQLLESTHLPLGILEPAKFDAATQVLDVAEGDRLLLFTDGVVEAMDEAGSAFGFDRLDLAVRTAGAASGSLLNQVHRELAGFSEAANRSDDLTLLEVRMVPPAVAGLPEMKPAAAAMEGAGDWLLTYELRDDSLRVSNPLPMLQQILMESPQLRDRSGDIFTVLSELYSNALEHGLLRLDSGLKASTSGFIEYYRRRDAALAGVAGFVRFEMTCRRLGAGGELSIRVSDSGPGHASVPQPAANAYSGRGYRLLQALCREVRVEPPGNATTVVLDW